MRMLKSALCALTLVLFAGGIALADDKDLTGTIKIVKSKTGRVVKIEFTSEKEKKVYRIMMDSQGRKLSKESDGAKIVIKGMVSKRGKTTYLTVKTFVKVEDKPSDKAKGEGNAGEGEGVDLGME